MIAFLNFSIFGFVSAKLIICLAKLGHQHEFLITKPFSASRNIFFVYFVFVDITRARGIKPE